ncbi:hypothetical protein R6Q57_015818 [Mikania cordata]
MEKKESMNMWLSMIILASLSKPSPPWAPTSGGAPATSSRPRTTPPLPSPVIPPPCSLGKVKPYRNTGGAPNRLSIGAVTVVQI